MDAVAELALKEYNERSVAMQPMYPAVLLRVLPKAEQTESKLLYLPQTEKAASPREGIVLKTYKPYTYLENGIARTITSILIPGDHVIFPWWSGEPVPFLEQKENIAGIAPEYRLVPEKGYAGLASHKETGEIFLKVSHTDIDFRSQIKKHLEEAYWCGTRNHNLDSDQIIAAIEEEFDISVKITTPQLTR